MFRWNDEELNNTLQSIIRSTRPNIQTTNIYPSINKGQSTNFLLYIRRNLLQYKKYALHRQEQAAGDFGTSWNFRSVPIISEIDK